MRVISLLGKDFTAACRRLQTVMVSDGYEPQLVVGIATGGAVVGARLFPATPHCEATCRRPESRKKRRLWPLMRLLSMLPRPLTDALRRAEARRLARRAPQPQDAATAIATRTVVLSDSDKALISSAQSILVADDAVDSGVTLAAVVDKIKSLNPSAMVRTAVITITTPSPLLRPDYSLYSDNTLIRFPWSGDTPRRLSSIPTL